MNRQEWKKQMEDVYTDLKLARQWQNIQLIAMAICEWERLRAIGLLNKWLRA